MPRGRLRDRHQRALRRLALAAALCFALAGCGGGSESTPPQGPLAEALGEVSGSEASSGALGVGWSDPQQARAGGVGPRLIADALGPNARTVLEAAPALRRRFGIDPLAAERLISIGGSYAFGLRLDGIDGKRLRDALLRAGGTAHRSDGFELVNVAGYAEVPEPLLRSQVFGLGARDAFGPSVTALAISETARDSLLGRGRRAIDQPTYRAAAGCLGEVLVARMIPDKLLISVDLGVDLVAIGVGREREVLCLLGGTPERADQVAANLRQGLAPGATEPRTGEPIAAQVRSVEVSRSSSEGVEVVRATMTPAASDSRDFLFGTIGRGSLPDLINGSRG